MSVEKRKDARIRHRETVVLTTGAGAVEGTSVNISRTGMQVVVRVPESFDSVRSTTFTVPSSGERLQLPCKVVRNTPRAGTEERILGIEFLEKRESQLLLIDTYIRDVHRQGDPRQLPRTSCHIVDVSTGTSGVQVLSIENLSVDGLLVSYTGTLRTGDSLSLAVSIPGDDRPLRLEGTIVFVVDNVFRENRTAGIRLSPMKELEERRLGNLVLACSTGSIIRSQYHHLQTMPLGPEFSISDHGQIAATLLALKEHCTPVSLLIDGSFTLQEQAIVEVTEDHREFSLGVNTESPPQGSNAGRAAYFAFSWNGSSYYFKTEAVESPLDGVSFAFPALVFRSDNRSYQRKLLRNDSDLRITLSAAEHPQRGFTGSLVDIGRRGFLCEVLVPDDCEDFFRQGTVVRYACDESLGLDSHGQIRHVSAVSESYGVHLRLGIEAGIERRTVPVRRMDADEWQGGMPYQDGAEAPANRIESLRVRFTNSKGQEIRGLVNATSLPVDAPVVIIPPAYGKKKEAYSPLVATLLGSSWANGRDLVTLRYDGVNRPGESHQDKTGTKRGYEMLGYRWSQGLVDLKAAIAFARGNPHFKTRKLILVTFSMSAIEARKLLAEEPDSGVELWISCMGAPSAQSTLRNVLGGIDVISNFRKGIPNGIMGMLGHLIDMDGAARDFVEAKYAYRTDARLDMSRIGIPVFWIYGQFDKWIDTEEVTDLMSVTAAGSRELLEIPAGHNLRTSNDAIQTFKLIAAFIHEKLHGVKIIPPDPAREEMMRVLAAEREQVIAPTVAQPSDYWRDYLIGDEKSSGGYDFYRNIEEFTGFLRAEAHGLALEDREVVADLGCGTGLFLEILLDSLARTGRSRRDIEITAVDLVPEALEKARAKCEGLISAQPALTGLRLHFVQGNLEPNRLIPVAHFIQSESSTIGQLRGKIEGLSSETVDRLALCTSPELDEFLRGGAPTVDTVSRLRTLLDVRDVPAVLDLNRAARFLAYQIEDGDRRSRGRSSEVPQKDLRTSDLLFDALNFGDYDRSFEFPFPGGHFTKIVASLFISYLFNPQHAAAEIYRMLAPGGLLVVSSMKPDSDISQMFANFIRKLQKRECTAEEARNREAGLSGALSMLNEASSLYELEEDGLFKFYTADELYNLLATAGFQRIEIQPGMGTPPQAYMAIARKAL
jgi:SAM-dependent methyltransferase/dienelactone hydrolase